MEDEKEEDEEEDEGAAEKVYEFGQGGASEGEVPNAKGNGGPSRPKAVFATFPAGLSFCGDNSVGRLCISSVPQPSMGIIFWVSGSST